LPTDLAGLAIATLYDVDVQPGSLHPPANRRVADALDRRDRSLSDARNRCHTRTDRCAAEVDSAGAAQAHATAELTPLQVEHVPQHPK
jgi:hypothetical protein